MASCEQSRGLGGWPPKLPPIQPSASPVSASVLRYSLHAFSLLTLNQYSELESLELDEIGFPE